MSDESRPPVPDAEPSSGTDVTSDAAPESPVAAEKPARPRLSRRRVWLFRLMAMTLIPALCLGILELLLLMFDYGVPTRLFREYEARGKKLCVENFLFTRRFFPAGLAREPLPVAFPAQKPPGTYRIFVLGESAAMGFPGPSFSFARILEAMLNDRYPGSRFEVINVAMTAINSHVVLPIARECADREPDLFVVYMGNNEVVGPYGASGVLGPAVPRLSLIRGSVQAKATRTGQLISSLMERRFRNPETPTEWNGMEMFVESQVRADDKRLDRVYSHFENNLRDICTAGTSAGADVIVCTVASNLRSSPPFGSARNANDGERAKNWEQLFKQGNAAEAAGDQAQALLHYRQAAELDDQHADLHYRLARCLLAQEQLEEARRHFTLARDLDTLRFRTDSRMNAVVREVAAELEDQDVYLADVEQAFKAASPAGIPGDELFYEHVHLTFSGNYQLARTVFEQVTERLPESFRARQASADPLSEEDCKAWLAFTDWNEWNALTSIEMLLHQPPFSTQTDAEQRTAAVQQRITELGEILARGGSDEAIRIYRRALQRATDDYVLHMDLGFLLMTTGKLQDATIHFFEVQEALPHHPAPHIMLAHVRLGQGKLDEALAHCSEALERQPESAQALELRDQIEAYRSGAAPAEAPRR